MKYKKGDIVIYVSTDVKPFSVFTGDLFTVQGPYQSNDSEDGDKIEVHKVSNGEQFGIPEKYLVLLITNLCIKTDKS